MLVSVIMANYNYGQYIGASIRSLLDQSMNPREYEIIVVDDGSTDCSMDSVEPYLEDIYLIRQSHQGVKTACNEAFKRAQGQYIIRVDSDDYVNRLLLEIETLLMIENKHFDAVSCDYYRVDEDDNRVMRCYAPEAPIACGVMFRRDKLFEAGLYDDNGDIWDDTRFVSTFIRKYRVFNIPLPLYRYRQHGRNMTELI